MEKYLMLVAAYVFITFAWAYLFNEILFKGQFTAMTSAWRDPPIFALGFLTMFIQTGILYVLYAKFFTGKIPFRESVTLIYLVGSFDILVTSLIIPATIEINPVWKFALLKFIYGVVHYGIVGIVLAFIFQH